MITMQVSMTVPPGSEEAWEEARRYAHSQYPRQPGFRGARVLRDCDHPNRYVMQSDWDSRADADHAVRTVAMPWLTRGLDLNADAFAVAYFETVHPLGAEEPAGPR
jgi:quinol monooxygenase YgiN